MFDLGLLFFGIYLLGMLLLDLGMLVSLIRSGDERRQLIVWKASSFTLLAVMGSLVVKIIECLMRAQPVQVNPFILLTTTATLYFLFLLYYKKKHGD